MRRPLVFTLILLTILLLLTGAVLLFRQTVNPTAVATIDTAEPDAADLAAVPRVTIEALREQLQTSNPPLVWDFRPTASFAEGHIPGSHVLTLDAIPDAAANVDKRQAIVTVCA